MVNDARERRRLVRSQFPLIPVNNVHFATVVANVGVEHRNLVSHQLGVEIEDSHRADLTGTMASDTDRCGGEEQMMEIQFSINGSRYYGRAVARSLDMHRLERLHLFRDLLHGELLESEVR